MIDSYIFFIVSFLILGVGEVITSQNPVHSGLYLVLLFIIGSMVSVVIKEIYA